MSTLGEMGVGELVYLLVDGEETPFRVMQHGKPDDSYDDSYLEGTILCLDPSAEAFETQLVANTTAGKGTYAQSYLHQVLNQEWLAKLDSAMQQQVVEVKLPYRTDVDGLPYEAATGSSGLPAKIWVPSVSEVVETIVSTSGNKDFPYVEEGSLFRYWQSAELSQYQAWQWDNNQGLDGGWGTRTPNMTYGVGNNAPYFYKISGVGEGKENDENTVAVRPCLVLPDTLWVGSDGVVRIPGAVPVKVGGVWKEGTVWSKVGGAWKETAALSAKAGGVWKQ